MAAEPAPHCLDEGGWLLHYSPRNIKLIGEPPKVTAKREIGGSIEPPDNGVVRGVISG
jgi:hypothetical protein